VVGGLLGVEGLHFLDAEAPVEEMAFLYRRGLRIASLTHHFDNPLAGASTGCDLNKGLEPLGEQVLRFMLDNGIVLDLAHASSKTIEGVLDFKARYEMEHNKPQIPFFVSHTGINYGKCQYDYNQCQYDRNVTEANIKEVASSGGVIGVMYEPKALCCPKCNHEKLLNKIVFTYSKLYQFLSECYEKAICKRDGIWPDSPIDHIALGSDFDGAIPSPVDSSTAYMVLEKLRKSDFISGQNAVSGPEVALRKISGYNACKVIAHVLPQEQPEYGQTKALTIPDICEDLYGILKPEQPLGARVSD
jgi:microsomal dipeptidase-like Zn-dependent dipeptidase